MSLEEPDGGEVGEVDQGQITEEMVGHGEDFGSLF